MSADKEAFRTVCAAYRWAAERHVEAEPLYGEDRSEMAAKGYVVDFGRAWGQDGVAGGVVGGVARDVVARLRDLEAPGGRGRGSATVILRQALEYAAKTDWDNLRTLAADDEDAPFEAVMRRSVRIAAHADLPRCTPEFGRTQMEASYSALIDVDGCVARLRRRTPAADIARSGERLGMLVAARRPVHAVHI